MSNTIEKRIEYWIKKNKLFSNKEIVTFILENMKIDSDEANYIVRNKLYWLNREGTIERVGRGLYKNLLFKDINNYKEIEDIMSIIEIEYNKKWSYSSVSLEREIGMNIQMSNRKYINISARPNEKLNKYIKEFRESGIYLNVISSSKINSIETYSFAEILYGREFSQNEIEKFYKFINKKKIDIFDLIIENPINDITKKPSKEWINDNNEKNKKYIFKENFQRLMELKYGR